MWRCFPTMSKRKAHRQNLLKKGHLQISHPPTHPFSSPKRQFGIPCAAPASQVRGGATWAHANLQHKPDVVDAPGDLQDLCSFDGLCHVLPPALSTKAQRSADCEGRSWKSCACTECPCTNVVCAHAIWTWALLDPKSHVTLLAVPSWLCWKQRFTS